MPTGVCFGILRDLESLVDTFGTSRYILAFDSGFSLRREVYPNYKSSRRDKECTQEEQESRKLFHSEITRLRIEILPEAGYRNILQVRGYEADDILAKVAENLPDDTGGVIVSADEDLWQCLRESVICYNPISKKVTTARSFYDRWGIKPYDWAGVKAFAGCSSDDVEGLKGIGNATAAKWFSGTLKPTTKAWQKIFYDTAVFPRNYPIVKLPFPGLVLPELVPDDVTLARLKRVKAGLGILSRQTATAEKSQLAGLDL